MFSTISTISIDLSLGRSMLLVNCYSEIFSGETEVRNVRRKNEFFDISVREKNLSARVIWGNSSRDL